MICPTCHQEVPASAENSRPEGVQGVTATEKQDVSSVLEEYSTKSGVRIAIPKVSERRERFKKQEYTIEDVKAPQKFLKNLPRQDTELDRFGDLIFGEGLQQEI